MFQNAALKCTLTNISIEIHKLMAEHLPRFALRPDKKHTSAHRRYKVVRAPPTLDA